MRLMRLACAAGVAVVLGAGPAAAAWQQYVYKDLGLGAYFPGPPKREAGKYTSPRWGSAPATIFSTTVDDILYRITVAEFQDRVDVSATLMGECAFLAEDSGKEIANMTTRIGTQKNGVYGRLVTVDLAGNKGRAQTACLFHKGRLYKVEAIVLPAHGDPGAPEAIRFTNAVSLDVDLDYGLNKPDPLK